MGDVSDAAQMKMGHDEVQSAVNLLQQYQTCLTKQIAGIPAGGDSDQLKLAWAAQADAAIDAARHLAAEFSVQLRRFKARAKPGH